MYHKHEDDDEEDFDDEEEDVIIIISSSSSSPSMNSCWKTIKLPLSHNVHVAGSGRVVSSKLKSLHEFKYRI